MDYNMKDAANADRPVRGPVQGPVRAGIIGIGDFGTAILTQSLAAPGLTIPVVADSNPARIKEAMMHAGFDGHEVAYCDGRASALDAVEQGRVAVLEDASLMMDLPIDIVVESTGNPEAGARHVVAAIEHGKHVAMVNKEADVTVGPYLKHLADREGLVYTAVDGDQHGLLISLVRWAQEIGLEVVCGGKARDMDITIGDAFTPLTPGRIEEEMVRRREAIAPSRTAESFDFEELTIAANATGLEPDIPTLHAPVVRIGEIASVLCHEKDGGLLKKTGAVDIITCLNRPDEPGFGGGVFIVVSSKNAYSRSILQDKGAPTNPAGTAALVYRPFHFCGVEAIRSILLAVRTSTPTGAIDYTPKFDVYVRAAADLPIDENDSWGPEQQVSHSEHLSPLMLPAQPIEGSNPLPLQLLAGNSLTRGVKQGEMLCCDMISLRADSTLVSLRRRQDRLFLANT